MNLTEKISYIRGLCDGLELDESKPEVKVLNAIIDLLDDMAFEVSDMEELMNDAAKIGVGFLELSTIARITEAVQVQVGVYDKYNG